MKILFICLFPIEANNSAMMRNIALVNGLITNDCEVDFVTIPARNNIQVINKDEKLEGINIVRLKGNDFYNTITSIRDRKTNGLKNLVMSTLRKIYHKLTVYDYTLKIARQVDINILNNKEYDLVISSSDPKTSHIAANNLIKQGLKYKKWIQYWGDPMALDITNSSIYPRFYLKKIEHNLLKNADSIIYVSPFTYEAQMQLFPDLSERMKFVPIPYKHPKIYRDNKNSKLQIGYFGAYMKISRNLEPLYNLCASMPNELDLILMGETDSPFEEKDNIKILSRGNVEEYEAKVDILVCVLNKKGTQIPGKVYHYAATNKPILIILDGEKKEIIQQYLVPYNRYIFCDNNKEDIESVLRSFMEKEVQYTPCESFDCKIIANKILSEL